MAKEKTRCRWAGTDPLMIRYHDEEWGVPVHDDRHFFEMLTLEGAQAGLSWMTILRKRESYQRAFDDFDVTKIAKYDARRVAKLMENDGIVRNRLKIASTITNAKAFIAIQREFGSFDAFVWPFVSGKPIRRQHAAGAMPASTDESDALGKALKKREFRFVGTTILYAFMQACGLVNDHEPGCFRANAKERG
jgi:DNA-3-methyladenine glycosylase I